MEESLFFGSIRNSAAAHGRLVAGMLASGKSRNGARESPALSTRGARDSVAILFHLIRRKRCGESHQSLMFLAANSRLTRAEQLCHWRTFDSRASLCCCWRRAFTGTVFAGVKPIGLRSTDRRWVIAIRTERQHAACWALRGRLIERSIEILRTFRRFW